MSSEFVCLLEEIDDNLLEGIYILKDIGY